MQTNINNVLCKIRCKKCNNYNCIEWHNDSDVYQCNKCYSVYNIDDNIYNPELDFYEYDLYYEQLI